ncbi:MAG: 50S ribosomal protein L1 [Planctomycetota bacterium]
MVSKRHRENLKLVDQSKTYTIEEAVQIVKAAKPAKFDETVNMAIALNIDATQADQQLRGSFSFPHGVGKKVRVIAICDDSKVEEAKQAGAMEAGSEALAKRIEEGWLDFDVMVAQPSMMRVIGKLGRILGPKGLMPSPKSGSVQDDIARMVREFAAGKIEYRNDKQGNILVPVGKLSFAPEALAANIKAFFDYIVSIRPSTVRDTFIKRVAISSTMGPGVTLTT